MAPGFSRAEDLCRCCHSHAVLLNRFHLLRSTRASVHPGTDVMAECDLAVREPTLGHMEFVGKRDHADGSSSSAQQLRPTDGSSRDLESSSSLVKPPVYPCPSALRRGNLGASKIGKPLGRARLDRTYLVKERSSGFTRMLKVRHKPELTDDKT